jgi:uncharacterized protein YdeI (YjbR/CyaY-like superfamily)
MATKTSRTPAPKVEAPTDLRAALAEHPKAGAIFDRLSPSHQREYVKWISGAKRPQTRKKRIAGALDRIIAKSSAS